MTPDDQFAGIFSDPRGQPKPVYENMTDDPEYQAWVESMAKYCHCEIDRPCDGVLAGGLCDNIRLHDDYDDDWFGRPDDDESDERDLP